MVRSVLAVAGGVYRVGWLYWIGKMTDTKFGCKRAQKWPTPAELWLEFEGVKGSAGQSDLYGQPMWCNTLNPRVVRHRRMRSTAAAAARALLALVRLEMHSKSSLLQRTLGYRYNVQV